MAEAQRSPWVYVGCGCAAIAGAVVLALVVAGFFGARWAKDMADTMEDPVARAEKSRKLLGATTLPEGLNTQLAISIPWVMDVIILTDGPPIDQDDARGLVRDFDQMFLFVSSRAFKAKRGEIDRFLRGEIDGTGIFNDIDIEVDFEPEKLLERGTIRVGDRDVLWAAYEGEIDTEVEDAEGVMAFFGFDCPGDDLLRLGTWFKRDAVDADTASATPRDLTGTPADEVAARDLIGHFDVCAGT